MTKKTQNVLIVISVLAVLFIVGKITGPPVTKNIASTETKNVDKKEQITESVVNTMGNAFIKRAFKAPSTADFPLYDWKAYSVGENKWVYRGAVDAQNEFGAKIRSWFLLEMKFNGSGDIFDANNWTLVSIKEQ